MSISDGEGGGGGGGGGGGEGAEVKESDGPTLAIGSEPGRFIPPSCVSLEILERHIPLVYNAVIAVVNKACLVSLKLLEGDKQTTESFLNRFVTITDNTKFIRFTNFIPLDDPTMDDITNKLCLNSVPDTAVILASRNEKVECSEDVGERQPLRKLVLQLMESRTAGMAEMKAEGSANGFLVFGFPATRFASVLKRSIKSLELPSLEENNRHLIVAVIPQLNQNAGFPPV